MLNISLCVGLQMGVTPYLNGCNTGKGFGGCGSRFSHPVVVWDGSGADMKQEMLTDNATVSL